MLIGDTGVGKTALLSQYITHKAVKPKPTIGVEFSTQVLTMEDNVSVKAQIWDTAGQEKYKAVTAAYLIASYHFYIVTTGTQLERLLSMM